MNTVYFPVKIAVLLRRLANILSTLSISNQYVFLGNANARSEGSQGSDFPTRIYSENQTLTWICSCSIRQALSEMAWPYKDRWGWWKLSYRDHISLPMNAVPEPRWIGSNWFWPIERPLHDAFGKTMPCVKFSSKSTVSTTMIDAELKHPLSRIVQAILNRPFLVHIWSSVSRQHETASDKGDSQPRPPPNLPPDVDRKQTCPVLPNTGGPGPDAIQQLLKNPALYAPLRAPRYPVVLCHGLYGFDVRSLSSFPSLRVHYWSNVLDILRNTVGANVIVTAVPGTGSIATRAHALDLQLQKKARGQEINFVAHSMGGLDCRYLISHIHPGNYLPLSLLTIGTPHRGSPFMDWCADTIGIGKPKDEIIAQLENKRGETMPIPGAPPQPPTSESYPTVTPNTSQTLPTKSLLKPTHSLTRSLTDLSSSFTTLLLSLVDTPAYFNLTTSFLANHFNPLTPDNPRVKYFSVAGRLSNANIFHPFWFPKMVLDGVEEKERRRLKEESERSPGSEVMKERPLWARDEEWGNDGLVPIQSAKWGEFLGVMEGCDHWEMRGARGLAGDLHVDLSITDGWGLRDWGKLVAAFGRKEIEGKTPTSSQSRIERGRREAINAEKGGVDMVVKSSTEKLSAVFDWIAEQVPSPPKLPTFTSTVLGGKKVETGKRHQLASKTDLERFYVALSRKLYDEGF